MSPPRTHYQISLTARQALSAFVGLLFSLALAYFLGLKTGLSGRRAAGDAKGGTAESIAQNEAGLEPMPPIETAVPTAAAASGPPGSRTILAGGAFVATPPPTEAASPATLQPFEDAASEESATAASPSSPPAERPAGKFWVQVASLSSREEAGALSGRLSRHGFRAQVLTAAGPKGMGRVYRVRVGPYPSEQDAGRAASKLSKQEKLKSPWVVPDGQ